MQTQLNPTQTQLNPTRLRQLLRASFLQNAAGRADFQAWNAQIDWQAHVNWDEYRLLPQLYRTLSAQQFQHPLLPKFKGIARKAWYNNRLYFHALTRPLNIFRAANIPTLLLYGGALALHYDNEYIMPANGECGMLVHEADAPRAFRQLERVKWNAGLALDDMALDRYVSARYFHTFQNAQGARIILQWQLIPHCSQQDTDAEFWTRAQETQIEEVPVLTLEPTDQLIHTGIYGAQPRGATSIQRGIDVMLLLSFGSAQINWQAFLARIQAQRVTLPIVETLRVLASEFELPIPSDILEKIKTLPVPADEQHEKPLWDATTSRARAAQLWYVAARRTCDASAVRRALQFPKFLQNWWGLEHAAQLPPRGLAALNFLR